VDNLDMPMRKTVRSRRLGHALREMREEAQLDQATLAARIGVSQSHLSRVESGTKNLGLEQLRLFAVEVGAKKRRLGELEALWERADAPGWWQEYGDILPQPVEMLIELGEEASWLRTFDNVYVQGMLQTRDYAEAVISCGKAHIRMSDVDRLVDLRMRRQKRLTDQDFRLTAVMTEGVIRQQVGGARVMRAQLQHLLDVSEHHDVTVHVLPFIAGAHPGMDSVVIFDFSEEGAPEAVYVDSDTAWRVHEQRAAIRQCTYTFHSVLAQALPARESVDMLRNAMREMS
jgi:transcriptional regulator with XRE-family HTH domain